MTAAATAEADNVHKATQRQPGAGAGLTEKSPSIIKGEARETQHTLKAAGEQRVSHLTLASQPTCFTPI